MASKKIVAVVDDDVAIREAMDDLLRSLGYECRAFPSAEEFLSHDTTNVDCILLDVNMTGISGLELQRQLNSSGRQTPVIFLSSYNDERTVAAAMANGAQAFLSKPVEFDSLMTQLETALH
ncbi:response regulator [Aliirhizobium terrae]|uniref:response regulator transcription factor n=1 Tax=Terrirhizobium terrae TaxID=2926709 RepID=UPI00257598D5|nr:response regulator [Rhizobium sp. CC-CFT758]WJH41499.1 response regulator [Rhizobium sp. CC-CFT758]